MSPCFSGASQSILSKMQLIKWSAIRSQDLIPFVGFNWMSSSFTLPVDHMCTAISYGYASPSQCYIAEYPAALEVGPFTKNLADTASLYFKCYAPNWRIATGGGKELAVIAHANPPRLYPETAIVIECKSKSL